MLIKTAAVYRNGKVEFAEPQKAPPDGTSVVIQYELPQRKSFSAHSGVLGHDQADEMMVAIEEACERINGDEW
jgi:hypothetical protein